MRLFWSMTEMTKSSRTRYGKGKMWTMLAGKQEIIRITLLCR